MKVACWNVAWSGPRTKAGKAILEKLLDIGADIICCPEAHDNFLPAGWHGAFSDPDYGYPLAVGRRKVTLWSRQPWYEVDMVGSPSLPPGRFVSATTATELGDICVLGVCIPWRLAHVSTGHRNRTDWQDHRAYLEGLRHVPHLMGDSATPRIIVGDFNQRTPPAREPRDVSEQLRSAMTDFQIWTAGSIPGLSGRPVCHIGGSSQFDIVRVSGISRLIDGRPVSDHDGIAVEIALR